MINSILDMNILWDYSIDMNYNVHNLPIYVQDEDISDFPQLRTSPHWNEGLEIIHIHKGRMNIVENGSIHQVSDGNICVINSGCLHYFESINSEACSYTCYVFEKSIFATNVHILQQYINPLFHSFNPDVNIIRASDTDAIEMSDILTRINCYVKEKKPAYELHISGLLTILIATLYNTHSMLFNSNADYNSKLDDSMRHMLSFIHKNYSHAISSKELCAIGQLSRTGCFSLFKKYTGDTPSKFVLKYRLSMARNQLSNTNTPIAQIATNCGFSHQSHLTSHFKKYYGLTPLEYRKRKKAQTLSTK